MWKVLNLYFFLSYKKITSWIFKISNLLGLNKIENIKPVISDLTDIEKYISQNTKRFLDTYQNNDKIEHSENIDRLFYNKEDYKEMFAVRLHPIELKWRTNVLMDYTPFGNVIMYYDTFRSGFIYYCDRNLSYPVLNAVAMKYVRTYKCRDFFMDENIIPDNYVMPIVNIMKEYEKCKENDIVKFYDKYKAPYKNVKKPNENLPFLKNKKIEKIKQDKEKELMTNKFIYSGKCTNYLFIQKHIMNNRLSLKKPDDLENSSTIVNTTASNDYKLWKKMSQNKDLIKS